MGKYKYHKAKVFYETNGIGLRRKITNKERLFIRVHTNIMIRCYNPKASGYVHYGGKGIKISRSWLNFRNFHRDMYSTYKVGLTIERINSNKDYCKENCKWATVKEQMSNRSVNRNFTFKGITKNLAQWAEYIGVKKSTIYQRYHVYHWNIEKCLTYKKGGLLIWAQV